MQNPRQYAGYSSRPPNPYKLLGDRIGLSEVTIRKAMARQPVPLATARRIAKALDIDIDAFRIKADNRGKRKPKNINQQGQ